MLSMWCREVRTTLPPQTSACVTPLSMRTMRTSNRSLRAFGMSERPDSQLKKWTYTNRHETRPQLAAESSLAVFPRPNARKLQRKGVRTVLYQKPQLTVLSNAIDSIRGGKNSVNMTDMSLLHTTVNAYESDE